MEAALFNQVMDIIWETGAPEPGKIAKALASYVKNHRVNHENAFEVLNILFDGCSITPRKDDAGVTCDDESDVWYDVLFADRSQVLLMSRRGIGSAIEMI